MSKGSLKLCLILGDPVNWPARLLFQGGRFSRHEYWSVLANNGCHTLLQFSPSVVSDSLQHARPPCPSSTPEAYPNSCPLSQWCHPSISSSVTPCSPCAQAFPASVSLPMSWLFTSGGVRSCVRHYWQNKGMAPDPSPHSAGTDPGWRS